MPGQLDPLALMADTFLRLVALEAVKVIVWAPILTGLFYFHARWSKGT